MFFDVKVAVEITDFIMSYAVFHIQVFYHHQGKGLVTPVLALLDV